MAAKKKNPQTRTRTEVIRVSTPKASAPIVIKQPSAVPARRARGKGRRRKSVGGGGGRRINAKTFGGVIIGGALLGWLEKNYGAKFPSIPFLGTKGTIAAIAYFANKNGFMPEISADVCIAAGATSGYQLGKEGKISGDVDGDIVPQVGIAAQV